MIAAIFRAIVRRIIELRIRYYDDVLELVAEQRRIDAAAEEYATAKLAKLRRRLQCHAQAESNLATRAKIRKIAR